MNEIALMFSGGVDSTAAAVQLADRYDRVHLLTYVNGLGHYGHGRTRARAEMLMERLGHERFTYRLIRTRAPFEELVLSEITDAYAEYGGGFVWCLGCKLAMHAVSAAWCLIHGVDTLSDGSSSETDEMVEQTRIAVTLIGTLYADAGVTYGVPVYEDSRDDSREVLRARGISLGLEILDRNIGIQPRCIGGELAYLSYVLFNKRVQTDEAQIARFIEDRREPWLALVRRMQAEGLPE